jgi:hypothetical protein
MARKPTLQHEIKHGKIVNWPDDALSPEEIAVKVKYIGSPIHKSYTSPAGPPALKADEAKCDKYNRSEWQKLTEVLQDAIRAQCVGQFRGEFPSRAWAWINGVLHEARLTGQGQGDYHGFPINDKKQYPLKIETREGVPDVIIPIDQA